MTTLGQICLLVAMVGSGFGAFACLVGSSRGHKVLVRSWRGRCHRRRGRAERGGCRSGVGPGGPGFQLRLCGGVFQPGLLPWQFALSAFWVGQAGSLLLWAWFLGILAMVLSLSAAPRDGSLAGPGLRRPHAPTSLSSWR